MESTSFSGSSKRAKALGSTAQITRCSVDECNADLSLCRDYHRRHKVCEMHSKTPKVTIGGREQRFCQQCSRFHSLVEFDEGKRSCRKRLDGHNRRRRKPQPDSTPRNSGPVFSIQPGISSSTLLSFSNPQILPTASWTGAVKPDNNTVLYNNRQQIDYAERQHTFLDSNTATRTSSSSGTIFSNQVVVDSDRALSLLSSAPPQPVTREFGINHVSQRVVRDLQYGGLGQYRFISRESKPVVSAADSGGSDASTLHFPEMLHHGAEGSSTTGSNQTLTFMWE